MLKVALFTDGNGFAGTERHILELARGLKDKGVAVSLACPRVSALSERAAVEAIPVIAVEKRGRTDFGAVRQLAALLASGEIEILHTHNGRSAVHAALAVSRARRGCTVATQHFIDPARTKRRGPLGAISRAIHGWVSARTAQQIAISEAARRAMIERGEPAEKITVVPNGITAPDVTQLRSAAEVRAQLRVADDAPLIVCVARLEPEKDVPTLVRAMAHVRALAPKAVCVIAGEGSRAESLAAQVREAKLESSVILAGFQADALSLIHAADVFVLPSLAEPFGLVLLEAMSLGKPVLATRAGGPIEIVEEGRTGVLVPPGDAVAMGSALAGLLAVPADLARFGANGRARFEEFFTTRRMAEGTLTAYECALAR